MFVVQLSAMVHSRQPEEAEVANLPRTAKERLELVRLAQLGDCAAVKQKPQSLEVKPRLFADTAQQRVLAKELNKSRAVGLVHNDISTARHELHLRALDRRQVPQQRVGAAGKDSTKSVGQRGAVLVVEQRL